MYAEKKVGSSLKIGMSTVSALCQIITVYSAKHGIIRCIAEEIYNENDAGEATGFHSSCFLGTLKPSKYQRPSLSFLPPFFRAILSFEPSEPPSLICLLQVPRRASLCLKRKHPCGLPAAPRRKDRLHKRSANCLPITDTVILSSHPEGCQVLSVKLKVSSQAYILLKKSVKGIKSQARSAALSGDPCSPALSMFSHTWVGSNQIELGGSPNLIWLLAAPTPLTFDIPT